MKNKFFLVILCLALVLQTTAQLSVNATKFDYKSITITCDALVRKFTKADKIYYDLQKSFKYNYPAEIENSAGGYTYRGKIAFTNTKSPQETDTFTIYTKFGGLISTKSTLTEKVQASIPGSYNTTTAFLPNYALVYPVSVMIYKKGQLFKSIDFFTEASPLNFRFSKELVEPTLTSYNTPFSTELEIANYETAGKLNKAAEKYAYFSAIKKNDEVLKNYFGSFDYDIELGSFSIKQKKADKDYSDFNAATDILQSAISAFKKKDMVLKDSLAATALKSFSQLLNSSDPKITTVAKEVLVYNCSVGYALLGNIEKADEYLKMHMQSALQKEERFSGTSIETYLNILKLRKSLAENGKISL